MKGQKRGARPLKQQGERERRERLKRRRIKAAKKAAITTAALLAIAFFAYWAYGKVVEKPKWRSVPTMPSYHLTAAGLPHEPYNTDPPTSGPHVAYIAKWGVHTEPIPKELQVHNLEDGGVLVQYNCPKGCPDLVAKLEGIVKHHNRAILAPYPGMENTIALTAWGVIDTFDEFDEKRITRFIKAHIDIDHHR